jgi:putative transcriptional regulator
MRERRQSASSSIAGSLLLAHPVLKDPNFRRTVVLMSSHTAEGAMGVVLNRPMSRKLGDLNVDFALGPLRDVPLYSGGPVETKQLLLAAWQTRDDGFQMHFGIEPEKAAQMATEEGVHIRAFLGYSGWTGGQLERELKHDTWIVTEVPADLLEHPQDDALWRGVLAGVGEEWRLLADEPDDPSRN